MGGQGSPDSQALGMSQAGLKSPAQPGGGGAGSSEQMRAILRAMMMKNPTDPIGGGGPSSMANLNKMLLASFNQTGGQATKPNPLAPPALQSPARQANVQPMSV